MKKRCIIPIYLVALACLTPVGASAAAESTEGYRPFDGQLFDADGAAGNIAVISVRFPCPAFETERGEPVKSTDYRIIFERKVGSYAFFWKRAVEHSEGRCLVAGRFGPGSWTWRVWVDKADTKGTRLRFFVESAPNRQNPVDLTRAQANGFMRQALWRHFGGNWDYGFKRKTGCRFRLAKDRLKCSPISWYTGDLGFLGRGRIWLTYPRGVPTWNYAFRVFVFDEYCYAMGGSVDRCSRTVRVKGRTGGRQ